MNPTLNGTSATRRFKRSDAIEMHERIIFDFCTGLSYVVFSFKAPGHEKLMDMQHKTTAMEGLGGMWGREAAVRWMAYAHTYRRQLHTPTLFVPYIITGSTKFIYTVCFPYYYRRQIAYPYAICPLYTVWEWIPNPLSGSLGVRDGLVSQKVGEGWTC